MERNGKVSSNVDISYALSVDDHNPPNAELAACNLPLMPKRVQKLTTALLNREYALH